MFRLTVISLAAVLAACGSLEEGELEDLDDAPPLGEQEEGVFRSALVHVEGNPVELDVQDFDGTYVLEGDIVLDPDDVQILDGHTQPLAAVKQRKLWPNGVIYYRFSSTLPDNLRQRARDAMAAWENRTALRFVKAPAGSDAFVKIVYHDKNWCAATIGYTGTVQYMWLSQACPTYIVKHEFGHTIGLYHEQSRTDRPDHVRVLWDNIKAGFRSQFKTYLERGRTGRDVGRYTIRSIMHYGSYAFSRNGRPTMVRKSDGSTFTTPRRIHDRDAAGVDRIYAPLL